MITETIMVTIDRLQDGDGDVDVGVGVIISTLQCNSK